MRELYLSDVRPGMTFGPMSNRHAFNESWSVATARPRMDGFGFDGTPIWEVTTTTGRTTMFGDATTGLPPKVLVRD